MAGTLTELLLDRAHSAVVSMDEQGIITYWNPGAERIFGMTGSEALGQVMVDLLVPARYRDAHVHGVARFLATGEGPAPPAGFLTGAAPTDDQRNRLHPGSRPQLRRRVADVGAHRLR